MKIKLYPKITKTEVIKTLITIPLTLETMQQAAYYQNLKEAPGPLLPKKIRNMKKLQIFLKSA